MAADGGSWRRQSGGRDNGGIVRWRRWHGSARLGAAPRANSGHCLAPLGLSAATAPCPTSPWVRGAGPVPQPRVPGAVPGCARLCSHRPAGRGRPAGLRAAGTRSVWHGGTSQGGWMVWWLQKKMGTGGNGHHAVASAGVLPTLAPGARCGAVGRPMGQDAALCRASPAVEAGNRPWLPGSPAAPIGGSDAPGRAGTVAVPGRVAVPGTVAVPGRSGRARGSVRGAGRAEEAQGRRKGGRGQA